MFRNFIILDPDPIVRMDISGLLSAHFPGASVIEHSAFDEMGQAIHNVGPQTIFFIKESLISAGSALETALKSAVVRGSRIVVIGARRAMGFPADFLELPFDSDMVIAALTGADRGPGKPGRN